MGNVIRKGKEDPLLAPTTPRANGMKVLKKKKRDTVEEAWRKGDAGRTLTSLSSI